MGRRSSPRSQAIKGRLATLVLRFMSGLPLPLNRALGSLIGTLLWWLPSEARAISQANIAYCFPELPAAEQRRLVRLSLRETGKGSTELGLVWHRPALALDLVKGVEGEDALRQTLAEGRPVLLLVPHLGCWEVLNFWLSEHYPLHAMYNPSGLPAVDRLVRGSREHFGTVMYPATPRGVVSLVRALKKSAVLTAILPDQVPDRRSGRFVPFFGRPAYTATLSARLIQQTGARVFVASARRLPGSEGYRIVLREPEPALYDADLDKALPALNRSIETLIMEMPEQYLWSYKRFRRRPEGAARLYR
ncbi:lysophospholipid acyltransferase family protein [Alcanivorax quisquiliarum]|uniref:Lysophospholipid acyltransferase family protein n=1 Tax=Alcanivorax quisquiliarum TaxID=2933565 RepID=A0ABT0E448_9GAMM|nr:lysophospholipid acyltransferase family protein [Alcanivorax quisquiliarum]MCK0536474.1 lysophospholipid acyltransferase family protein [Alcanivorax quisquiliarum]